MQLSLLTSAGLEEGHKKQALPDKDKWKAYLSGQW